MTDEEVVMPVRRRALPTQDTSAPPKEYAITVVDHGQPLHRKAPEKRSV